MLSHILPHIKPHHTTLPIMQHTQRHRRMLQDAGDAVRRRRSQFRSRFHFWQIETAWFSRGFVSDEIMCTCDVREFRLLNMLFIIDYNTSFILNSHVLRSHRTIFPSPPPCSYYYSVLAVCEFCCLDIKHVSLVTSSCASQALWENRTWSKPLSIPVWWLCL